MSSRIRTIPDVRTLDWVSEVCEVDYPAFSDAASLRADTISDPSNFHRDIQSWKDTVAPDGGKDSDAISVETAIASLEDMTVTELKHTLSSYLLQARDDRLRAKISEEESQSSASSIFPETESFSEKVGEASYPPDVRKSWATIDDQTQTKLESSYHTKDEDEVNENIMEQMYNASLNQYFMDEIAVIVQWFEFQSPGEWATTFYKLGAIISQDPNQTRLFAPIQSHRMSSVAELQPSKAISNSQVMKTNTGLARRPQPNATEAEPERQHYVSIETNHSKRKRSVRGYSLAGLFSSYSVVVRFREEIILPLEQIEIARIEYLEALPQQIQLASVDMEKIGTALVHAKKERMRNLRDF
ncbi:MAG: hypothetical protein Q9214_001798 [Letrouitia sp. 1 TL-2023]